MKTDSGDIPVYPMTRDPAAPLDPPLELRRLRNEQPVTRVRIWDGSTPWLLTRYADQCSVLADARFSADVTHPGYPHESASFKARRAKHQSFIGMDGAEHARLRRMVAGEFTVRNLEPMRPVVQRFADALIDDMLAEYRSGPVDLIEAYAIALPSLTISELLGVPAADHAYFRRHSRALLSATATPQDAVASIGLLNTYIGDLITAKAKSPGDDLVSRLAVKELLTGKATHDELVNTCVMLLVASYETTANMIALGTLALMEHPDQLAQLQVARDPAVAAGAVEELLRYLNVTHVGRRRVAIADVAIGGQLIRAGEGVILANDAANRDERVFPNPDRLTISGIHRRHIAFGFGPHQCLGQHLARIQLQVTYGTLYRRIPTLRLGVELAHLTFAVGGNVYGLRELPVVW